MCIRDRDRAREIPDADGGAAAKAICKTGTLIEAFLPIPAIIDEQPAGIINIVFFPTAFKTNLNDKAAPHPVQAG